MKTRITEYNNMRTRVEEYKNFMSNPDNSHNCAECPRNEDFSSGADDRLPCGQFNCWVDCHCQN